MKQWDTGWPRESAERRLNVKPDTLILDELARRISMLKDYASEPLSVRDINTKPIRHSRVYLCGVRQSWDCYFVAKGMGVNDQ